MKINIFKIRPFSYMISVIMIALLVFGIFVKKSKRDSAFLYSIEFTGGIQIECTISSESDIISPEHVKEYLEKKDHITGVSVRKLQGDRFVVRVATSDASDINTARIISLVKMFCSERDGIVCTINGSSFLGAGSGGALKQRAIVAIFVAFILMFFYVWWRFRSWAFGFANSISLLHDILSVVLMILWFEYEVSMEIVGAILFILGYSINDTIVIFSRIRENMAKEKEFNAHDGGNFSDEKLGILIDKSISETLRRTILTSFFTMLVVLPLLLFGGVNLEPLSAAILLGIVFGTYSSIGIASPVLYDSFKLRRYFIVK